jgi:hypothetical protein
MLSVREYVVDGDDAVGSAGSAVVHDGGVGLDPDPSAGLGQPSVVPAARLPLVQH